jgi:uncharacterized coiled-coil DUF342 family protein
MRIIHRDKKGRFAKAKTRLEIRNEFIESIDELFLDKTMLMPPKEKNRRDIEKLENEIQQLKKAVETLNKILDCAEKNFIEVNIEDDYPRIGIEIETNQRLGIINIRSSMKDPLEGLAASLDNREAVLRWWTSYP